jgi:hypothetical protein
LERINSHHPATALARLREATLGALAVAALLAAGCAVLFGGPGPTVLQRAPSPDGRWELELAVADAGAVGRPVALVTVRPRGWWRRLAPGGATQIYALGEAGLPHGIRAPAPGEGAPAAARVAGTYMAAHPFARMGVGWTAAGAPRVTVLAGARPGHAAPAVLGRPVQYVAAPP